MKHAPSEVAGSRGRVVVLLLLAVNLLNYVDRQALYAVFPLIKQDLALSDTGLGLLGSAFMFSYMLAAPLFGSWGDRLNRSRLAAGGLTLWSLATILSGMAGSYRMLLGARALVGIGEASFGTVSPPLLADYVTAERRGRIMALFFLAIPVGSALGYILGGQLGQLYGWQRAFLLVGIPGLLLAVPLFLLPDPRHGGEMVRNSSTPCQPLLIRVRSFWGTKSYVYATLSMAAMTFALGGLAQWMPSFLSRTYGLALAKGNTLFGMITVVAGITGTVAGGWLGDLWQRRSPAGYLYVSAAGFLAGAPLMAAALLSGSDTACLAGVFGAELFLFLNTGPLNTVLLNVVKKDRRALAFAVNIFVIHALGDAISPAIIGLLSDRWGLTQALMITPVAVLVAAVCAWYGGRYVAQDQQVADGIGIT